MNEKKPSQAGRIILTVLLCIVLFFAAIGATTIGGLRQLASKNYLQSLLTQVLTGSAPSHSLRLGGLAACVPMTLAPGAEGEESLMSQLVDQYYDQISAEYEIPYSKDQVKDLLDQTSIPEYVADKASSVIADVVNETDTTVITKEEIQTLIEENREIIEEVVGQPIPEEVVAEINTWVDDNGDTLVQELEHTLTADIPADPANPDLSANTVPNPMVPVIQAVRTLAAPKTLISALVTCLVLSALIMLVNMKKLYAGLRSNGITYLLAGIVGMLPSLAGSALASLIPPMYAGILQSTLGLLLSSAAVTAGLGLVLLIGGIIWCAASKRNSAAETPAEM